MLDDRARIVLFWLTIGLMLVVAVLAAATILRACGGLPVRREPPPTISPLEITLCPGDQQQFAVENDVPVTWEASGGAIDQDGVFTAGDTPGDYTVTATREDSGQAAGAIVHVVACTPTPTATPLPTALPTVAPTTEVTPTAPPSAAPSPTPAAEPGTDGQGDVGAYDTGAAVESPPTGIDIRTANVGPDLSMSIQPTEDIPTELADWVEEGDALFWMSLHEAIPEAPAGIYNWLFVADADGNTETGRAAGSGRINPDLGDELAVYVSYNPEAGAFDSFSLVWDTDAGTWVDGPEVRHTFGESRTVLGAALSLESLEGALSETTGITLTTEAVRGRAGAESYTATGARVIDFYPNLPE